MNATSKPCRLRRTGALASLAAAVALIAAAAGAAPASADFGMERFDVTFTNADGTPATQAGSHPFAVTTRFGINATEADPFEKTIDGYLKDLFIEQPTGFNGDATLPRCDSFGVPTALAMKDSWATRHARLTRSSA